MIMSQTQYLLNRKDPPYETHCSIHLGILRYSLSKQSIANRDLLFVLKPADHEKAPLYQIWQGVDHCSPINVSERLMSDK